jgi:beta-glucanase (GH16 family)
MVATETDEFKKLEQLLAKGGATKVPYQASSLTDSKFELDIDELNYLKTYKHSGDKTTYETFLVEYGLYHVERALPASWSANTVTIVGQVPLIIWAFLVICILGPAVGPEHTFSPWMAYTGCFCL